MIPVFTSSKLNKRSPAYLKRYYSLYDRFSVDVAAGGINGTSADVVGGTRTAIDTQSKQSIANGVLSVASVTPSVAGDPGLWYDIYTRELGITLLTKLVPGTTSLRKGFGWDTAQSGAISDGYSFVGSGVIAFNINGSAVGGTTTLGTAYTTSPQQIAVTLRTAGIFCFRNFAGKWIMEYDSLSGNGNMYPAISASNTSLNNAITLDNVRVPIQKYIPVPIASDGFSATTTDGAGNPENNGTVGTAWTDIGTWGVASGVASCSVLSGSVGIRHIATSSSDVNINAVCTRTSGNAGIIARYQDANNYLIAYHDGTNARLDKVESGTTTNLLTQAKTYSAVAVIKLLLDGTTARLTYNDSQVSTAATVPASTSTNHGLYTTHIGATFDNFNVWARGNNNEYSRLNIL